MEASERFWAKTKMVGDCCEWQASLNSSGYGRFAIGRGWHHRNSQRSAWISAHRAAWELTNGPIPDGLQVLHQCDNRRCVRVEHLYLGTNDDNVRDWMERSGRVWAAGEAAPQAVFNSEQVQEIRRRFIPGSGNAKALAREYGVHYSTIYRLAKGRTYSGK